MLVYQRVHFLCINIPFGSLIVLNLIHWTFYLFLSPRIHGQIRRTTWQLKCRRRHHGWLDACIYMTYRITYIFSSYFMELYLEHGYLMVSMYDKQYICPVRVSLRLRDVWPPRRGVAFVCHRTWRVVLYDARDGHGQYAGYFHSVGRLMILMSHFYAFLCIFHHSFGWRHCASSRKWKGVASRRRPAALS